MSTVHERLRRLLFLVPYVSKHPGVTVDDLAKALNVKREDLLEELDLLTCVGRPPFNPDDYVDIYVDNDRVYVDLDQRLSRPPRLTADEAAALAASAELLRPAAGDALQSALQKLEKILPAGCARALPGDVPEDRRLVRGAPVAGAAHPGHPRAARGDVRLRQPGPCLGAAPGAALRAAQPPGPVVPPGLLTTPARTRACSGWTAWRTWA